MGRFVRGNWTTSVRQAGGQENKKNVPWKKTVSPWMAGAPATTARKRSLGEAKRGIKNDPIDSSSQGGYEKRREKKGARRGNERDS